MPGVASKAQKEEIAKNLFLAANPHLAAAYKMNPRTMLGNEMLSEGRNMAPVAGGYAEGLARLGSGIAGGLVAKQQQKKFGAADDATTEAIEEAQQRALAREAATAAPVAAPTPPVAPPPAAPPAAQVAAALGGDTAPGPAGGGSLRDRIGMGATPPGAPPPGTPPVPMPPGPPGGTAMAGGGPSPVPIPPGPPMRAPMPGAPPPVPMPSGPPGATVANALTGTPPPNPTVAPVSGRGAPTGAVNPVAAALTAQPAEEEVAGSQALPTPAPRPAVASLQERGLMAPRAERRQAVLSGKYGGRDDPYGAYGAVLGFGDFGRPSKPVPDMTVGEVMDFGNNVLIPATRGNKALGLKPDQGSSAVGGFQFTASTLKELAPKVLGDNWRNTTFSPDVQDKLAKELFDQRKGGNLKETWTSLPDSTPGAYKNKSWREMRDIIMKGESGGSGSGASGASGGGTTDATGTARAQVPGAPEVEIPDMPAAPVKPERPDLPAQAQSLRLAAAEELIKGRKASGLRASLTGPAVQAEWEAGTKEQDAYKTQARADLVQQLRDEFTSERSLYNENASALYKQPFAERTAAIGQKYGLQSKEYEAAIAAEQAAAEARNALIKQREDNEAQKERAEITASRMPAKQANKYLENSSANANIGNVLRDVLARPESVGLKYAAAPEEAWQRMDPDGVGIRAAIQDIGTLRIHERSGATVTASEWSRLKGYIPKVNDTPQALKYKLEQIQRVIAEENAVIETAYAGNPMIQNMQGYQGILSPVMQQAIQAPGWSK